MRQRAPLVLSMTALFVAVLGGTPLGHAGSATLAKAIPFAKLADNSRKLNGRRSPARPGRSRSSGRTGRSHRQPFRQTQQAAI